MYNYYYNGPYNPQFYCKLSLIKHTSTNTIAVGVTFTSLDFNVTEGDQFVEVCVEIVIGTVNEEDTVQVETVSGTATG